MYLPYAEELEIQALNRLFANTSECYKFFWFQGILSKIESGKTTMSFEEIVNEMIASAWYMVTEYHLNLGPRDNLELIVRHLQEISQLKSSEKKEKILGFLEECTDREVLRLKRILIGNVPYRLQSPLLTGFKNKDFDGKINEKIQRINEQKRLIYYFSLYRGMETKISIQPDWEAYIRKNMEILKGWLRYHMILYLQRRNPSVPGISDKLYPPQERKLEKVKKYWKTILGICPICDIYGERRLTERDLSIDHFIPWSYVAHDEFWNLHPTTRSRNSSKGNRLPAWEKYFVLLNRQEYLSYQMMWRYESVRVEFEKCAREHLNSDDIRQRLYRSGLSEGEFGGQLEEILWPVYQSARNSGFGSWSYERKPDGELL